jgi:RTX calcium-binding nonapeptide repeat (4 copies)
MQSLAGIEGTKWQLADPLANISFSYANSLPSYFQGVYTGFQELSSVMATQTTAAARSWGILSPSPVNGADVPIRIFLADNVTGYFDAFAPGSDGKAGDIVLNSAFYKDPRLLTTDEWLRNRYELVLAFGIALGLKETSQHTPQHTIMSTDDSSVLAITPTHLDFLVMERMYRRLSSAVNLSDFATIEVPAKYPLTLNQATLAIDHATPHIFYGPLVGMDFKVDLRPGFESNAVGTGGFINRQINGPYTHFVSNSLARFESENLTLIGNAMNNQLRGSPGNDFIWGGIGNDQITAGNGNDFIRYRFGDGHDHVNGGRLGEFNTLEVAGFANFRLDSLSANISFSKTYSQELVITLELEPGQNEGSVTVASLPINSGFSASVQRLQLMHGAQASGPVISLVDVYRRLAVGDTNRHFSLAAGSDQYGRLVTPV